MNPEDSIYYHYYEFKENQGGIHAYSINNSVFYEYSSVSEGRSFSIHFDVDESGELDPTSYRLDASDNENQLSYMIEVQNNEITSEMYFVYDDHGLLYIMMTKIPSMMNCLYTPTFPKQMDGTISSVLT